MSGFTAFDESDLMVVVGALVVVVVAIVEVVIAMLVVVIAMRVVVVGGVIVVIKLDVVVNVCAFVDSTMVPESPPQAEALKTSTTIKTTPATADLRFKPSTLLVCHNAPPVWGCHPSDTATYRYGQTFHVKL